MIARSNCHVFVVVSSAVDDDVTAGLLQRKNPRNHCLAYCRKLHPGDVAQPKKKVRAEDDSTDKLGQHPGVRHEEMWRKVEQHLGSSQAREYVVSGIPSYGELTTDHETYLQRLCDDFVTDMKAVISRRLEKMPYAAASSNRLINEVLHHAALAREMLETDGDAQNYGTYSELLHRLQSYVEDVRQSSRPFVIHGPRRSDVSAAMSAVAAALPQWMSASTPVTVLRFIGTTTDSIDVRKCVASIRAQIEASYCLDVSPARDSLYHELTALRATLEWVSSSHTDPLFILLDGIDALQPHSDALEAVWAVRHLPPNVYVIMSVNSGRQQTTNIVVESLLALLTDRELMYEISVDSEQPSSADPVSVLSSTLDTLEADFGPMIVKYCAVYTLVMDVGILDSELYDLLMSNDHVMAECSRVPFTPGIVSILRHRLADFLAPRLVCGCAGFSWSRPEYRQVVAERYQMTVGGADRLCDDFTLTLHQHVVQLYQNVTRKCSVPGASTSIIDDADIESHVRTTLQILSPQNPVKASRLFHHLRILLCVSGELSELKSRVLFNVDWLLTRLATTSVSQTIADVLSVYSLCRRRTIASFEDIGILSELLRLSSGALSVNHLSLAAEVVARIGHSSLLSRYQSLADLVDMSRRWLADTESSILVPLWSVHECPGGSQHHVLDGVTHVVGSVDGGGVVVGYSRAGSVGVWRVDTGLMIHEFNRKHQSDLPVSGVIAAHDRAFIITSCYSPVARTTRLNVLSTELGLSLLSLDLHRRLEALALSDDDRLLVVSSVSTAADGGELTRTITGIDLTSRDVVFQLPVVDVHAEGINDIITRTHKYSNTYNLIVFLLCLSGHFQLNMS